MQGSIEEFMSEIRDRINELASDSIISSSITNSTSLEDVLDWLADNAPTYLDDLNDAFGVNDLLYEADESEVWDAIFDNGTIAELLFEEFPDLKGPILGATNVGNIVVDPDLTLITGDDTTDEDYYNEVLSTVENKLVEAGPEVKDIKFNIDSILIIVNYDDKIHEYTVPFEDLTKNEDKDVNYILDAILSDLNVE